MDECFRLLNQQSQYIRLTRETPRDGWLPFLNVQVKLSTDIVAVKWYRKETSKNMLINAKSAHPIAMKRAVVRNMFKTAAQVCTGENERSESLAVASSIANSNGYSARQCSQHSRRSLYHRTTDKRLPLCLPFISEQVSAAIQYPTSTTSR